MLILIILLIVFLFLKSGGKDGKWPLYVVKKRDLVMPDIGINNCTRAFYFKYLPLEAPVYGPGVMSGYANFPAPNMEYGEFYMALSAVLQFKNYKFIVYISGFHGLTAYFLEKITKVPVHFFCLKKPVVPLKNQYKRMPTVDDFNHLQGGLLLDFALFAPSVPNGANWHKMLPYTLDFRLRMLNGFKPMAGAASLPCSPESDIKYAAGDLFPFPYAYFNTTTYAAILFKGFNVVTHINLFNRVFHYNMCMRHQKYKIGTNDPYIDADTLYCENILNKVPLFRKEIMQKLGKLPVADKPDYYFESVYLIYYTPENFENSFAAFMVNTDDLKYVSTNELVAAGLRALNAKKKYAIYTNISAWSRAVTVSFVYGRAISGVNEIFVKSYAEAAKIAKKKKVTLLPEDLNSPELITAIAKIVEKMNVGDRRVWLDPVSPVIRAFRKASPQSLLLILGPRQTPEPFIIYFNKPMVEKNDLNLLRALNPDKDD